eukprot:jgi/Chrzof1/9277/UNPLg00244.t1
MAVAAYEPLLADNPDRFCMFPIKYPAIWEMYKKAEASFWTAEEIDLSDDLAHWQKLTDDERHFISHVLGFFATADGVVNENLIARFANEVQLPEARAFYGFQMAMEKIHQETYALLLETYIKDPIQKDNMFHAIQTIPCIQKKAEWGLKWIQSSDSFAERLVAFCAIESVYFQSSFVPSIG